MSHGYLSTPADTSIRKPVPSSERPRLPDHALTCERIDDFAALEQIAPEWDRIWREDPELSIFQNLKWVRAFWRAYGDDLELCCLVAYECSRVIGILPLVVNHGQLQFLGMNEADYNDVICRSEDAERVVHSFVKYLLAMPVGWRSGCWYNVASTSRFHRALQTLPPELKRHFQTVLYLPCPTIQLETDREETLRRLLQKDSLKRHENHLKKLGRLTFRHLQDRGEICQHLKIFFMQHTARHVVAGDLGNQPPQFLRPRSRAYYKALIEELDPSSELRFSIVAIDGRPVAYHLGFESKRTYLWYKPSFDVDLWQHSPGEVLLRNLLRYAQTSELREFDFTIGDEKFKSRFANKKKENLTVYIERNPASFPARIRFIMRTIKGWVKRQPKTADFARRMHARLRDVWRQMYGLGMRRYFEQSIAAAFSKYVFSYAGGFVFHASGGAMRTQALDARRLAKARLSDLVSVALEYPGFLPPAQLQAARQRLRSGDRVYLLQCDDSAVVIWCGEAQKTLAPKLGKHRSVVHENGKAIDITCSSPVGNARALAEALRGVIEEERSPGTLYAWCDRKQALVQQAFLAAGFHALHEATTVSMFNRVMLRRVHDVSRCQSPVPSNLPVRI